MSGLVPFNKKNFDLINPGWSAWTNSLDDFFADNWPRRRDLTADTFKIDVRDNGRQYIIEAELPGVEKDEVDLSLHEGRLCIAINKADNKEEKKENYLHRERRYSSMSRSIYLEDAAPAGIKARLEHGVLTITVDKRDQQALSSRIEIE